MRWSKPKEMITKSREMLDLVGMKERYHHLPSQLSGGQQQRVAIARALVNNPAIVIADEPTGNLDSKTGKNILDLIFQLRDQLQMTFIIATHDTHVAKLSDRVLKWKMASSFKKPLTTIQNLVSKKVA